MKPISMKIFLFIAIASIYGFSAKTTITAADPYKSNINSYKSDTDPYKPNTNSYKYNNEPYESNAELFALHPKVGILWNYYFADFRRFQGVEDCGLFTSGAGQSYGWGLFMEKKLSSDYFMGIGLVFNDRSGTFLNNNAFPSRNSNTGAVENVRTENMIDINLRYLELQPELRYTIADDMKAWKLRLMVAARAFNTYSNQSFKQYEKIASPENAVFIQQDGSRTQSRDIGSGSIRTINRAGLGISAGIENLMRAGGNVMISQQLAIDYNFHNVTTDASWTILSVRFDMGIRFGFDEKKPEIIEPEPQPIPKKDTTHIAVTPPNIEQQKKAEAAAPIYLSLKIRQGDDMEIVTGNEILATIPLVNAVFFANNSAELPKEYSLTPSGHNFFTGDPVARHYELIPRIATIIKKNSGANITLIGTVSGTEKSKANANQLAKSRATTVRDAFINLGIPKDIIKVKTLPAPRHRSNEDFELGIIENQRVDIEVSNAPLQEYVDVQKFSELRGSIFATSEFDNIPNGNRVIYSDDLSGRSIELEKPQIDTLKINKKLADGIDKLAYRAEIVTGDTAVTANGYIDLSKLRRSVIKLDLSKFEAILRFDYNSSKLSKDNKGLLKQLSGLLPADAVITISGSTDALGTNERNIILEHERSAAARSYIESISGDKFKFETSVNDRKFDEHTPQGRFLNRSIIIRVRR